MIEFLDKPGLDEEFRVWHARFADNPATLTLEELNAVSEKYGKDDNPMDQKRSLRKLIFVTAIVIGGAGCGQKSSSSDSRQVESPPQRLVEPAVEGFILMTGEGESLQNGIVVKASPATGTLGSILVKQTFSRGGTTNLHLHEQGDELFYVVSGHGIATLGGSTDEIGPGDVVLVPQSAVHRIQNLDNDEPLWEK